MYIFKVGLSQLIEISIYLFTLFFQKLLRLHDPASFCEKLDLYIFVLFSFIWSDGDLDIHVNYLGIFAC